MKRKNIEVEYDGISYTSKKQFADKNDISYNKLMYLIRNKDMSFDEAATTVLLEKMEASESIGKEIEKEPKEIVVKEEPKPVVKEKKKTTNFWQRPLYFDITDPFQIIHELKKMSNVTTINLIDFENVKKDKKLLDEHINNDNTLNIFFYNAIHHSNEFFSTIKGCTNINLQVQIFECANQLVDHLITYYLGAIRAAYPDMKFNIISRDTGFYGFIGFLNTKNIKGVGINYIDDKELRYKFSLCKYIITNNILLHRNCIATHELKKFFNNFYPNGMSNKDEVDLLESLIKFEMVTLRINGSFEWADFKMDHIRDFYENH